MKRVVLVLGGGGVKGMAHVGVWRALEEYGIRPAEILGTSIGALVGACIAGGEASATLAARALSLSKPDIVTLNRWALLFNGIRQPSVFRGDTFLEYIRTVLPTHRWDELGLSIAINAVHLETGRMEWFGAGGRTDVPLPDVVYASCALPVFYPPADLGGKLYVDGGVGDTLPVREAAARGADVIIAADVGAGGIKDSQDTVSKGMVAVHHRVFDILAYERKRAILDDWQGPELIYIRPPLDGVSTFDFTRTDFFLEEGYRAARTALAASPSLMEIAAGTQPMEQAG
jgi:NTE family protein